MPVVTAGHLSLNTEASQAGVFKQLVPASDLTARKTGFEHPLLTLAPLLLSAWPLNRLLNGSLFSVSTSPWNLGNHGFSENQPVCRPRN